MERILCQTLTYLKRVNFISLETRNHEEPVIALALMKAACIAFGTSPRWSRVAGPMKRCTPFALLAYRSDQAMLAIAFIEHRA